MTTERLVLGAVVLLTGLVTAVVAGPVLRWLPEPEAPDGPGYARLPTVRFRTTVGACSALAAAVGWIALPTTVQPLWLVLAVGGVLLAAVDLATTWLPLRLVQITWLSMAVAALGSALVAGDWAQLVRSGVGAAVAGGLYYLVWVVSRGGFGFGDVRYAPLLGAAAGAESWGLLLLALVAGTVVGGLVGTVHLLRHRGGGFAYAPSMLVGAYLAALTRWPG